MFLPVMIRYVQIAKKISPLATTAAVLAFYVYCFLEPGPGKEKKENCLYTYYQKGKDYIVLASASGAYKLF